MARQEERFLGFDVVKEGAASPQPAAVSEAVASERINVIYRVVTPLFCGGSGAETAELRLPSFKGVLRWWWRALAWSRLGGDLDGVQRAEAALFGSAGGGQSKMIMRLFQASPPKMIHRGNVLTLDGAPVGDGARYLGYGVMEAYDSEKKGVRKGQLIRPCLDAPFDLAIEIRLRNASELERELLLDALRAVGLLGGLGAKSRKGYGSLVLRSLSIGGAPVWSPPGTVEVLRDVIAKLLPAGSTPSALPPYTALSPRARVVLIAARGRAHPLALLDRIGREMMRYRSWGHGGFVLGDRREGNFKDDHDLMKLRARQRTAHPRRIVFGLPHNYGKGDEDRVGPAESEQGDRRASPLLVHVHECGDAPIAVLSFLPARFLSNGDAAKIDVGGKLVTVARDPDLWTPIEDLLRRFLSPDPKIRKEPFGAVLEVQR